MKTPHALFLAFFMLYISGCAPKKEDNMQEKINTELHKIDSLLRDAAYNEAMAKTLAAAYYKSSGQEVPTFLEAGEDTATTIKSVKEEKIATNLAGFYALECGIGLLSAQTNEKPVDWLQKILNSKVDSATVLLLNRFANATWKAGQPFRHLQRITRPTFTVFNFLPADEVKKDYDQIHRAAAILSSYLQPVKDSSANAQFEKIKAVMQNKETALAIADSMHAAYYINLQQEVPAFIIAGEDTATIRKSVKDQKIATNVAGFYALECGLNYFAAAKNIAPSQMLQSITDGTISKEDKMLLLRFANATWKAGQPFRSLDRIQKDNFIPFNLLSDAEVEKDMVQIKAAAEKLLKDLQ
ncbi:hypothetical protein BH10BAC2_BH10BAC2_42140 [soil metagenome]